MRSIGVLQEIKRRRKKEQKQGGGRKISMSIGEKEGGRGEVGKLRRSTVGRLRRSKK